MQLEIYRKCCKSTFPIDIFIWSAVCRQKSLGKRPSWELRKLRVKALDKLTMRSMREFDGYNPQLPKKMNNWLKVYVRFTDDLGMSVEINSVSHRTSYPSLHPLTSTPQKLRSFKKNSFFQTITKVPYLQISPQYIFSIWKKYRSFTFSLPILSCESCMSLQDLSGGNTQGPWA